MDEQELRELRDPANWEDEEDGARPPVKAPRAVVSVAFARDDFERVADHAKRHGMKTSEFIRKAALEQTAPRPGRATVVSVSGAVRTDYPSRRPRASRSDVRVPPVPAFTTA